MISDAEFEMIESVLPEVGREENHIYRNATYAQVCQKEHAHIHDKVTFGLADVSDDRC